LRGALTLRRVLQELILEEAARQHYHQRAPQLAM
jgi:hypothetical protein